MSSMDSVSLSYLRAKGVMTDKEASDRKIGGESSAIFINRLMKKEQSYVKKLVN